MKYAAHLKVSSIAVAMTLSFLQAPVLGDVPAPVPISHFEAQIDNSLALGASQAGIESAASALSGAQAKAGRTLIATNIFGPQRNIEDSLISRTFVRAEQDFAVEFPLLGTRATQEQDIATASGALEVARADYGIQRQQLLAQVREAYVNYWVASQSQQMAISFVNDMQSYQPANEALRKNGFWTQADELKYQDMVAKAQTDGEKAEQAQRDSISQLSLLTNSVVAPFTPVQPDFAACHPDAVYASNQAIASDPEIVKIKAQLAQTKNLLALQRWDGYDASLKLGAGAYVDSVGAYVNAPGGLGYRAFSILNVSMAPHPGRLRADEIGKLNATERQLKLMIAQREAELKTDVQVAIGDRDQIAREITQAGQHAQMLAENLRESRVRFTYVAPSSLVEVQQNELDAYNARMWMLIDQNALLIKVADLLQVSPDACPDGTMAHTNAATLNNR